jgi:hypothetical protein
MARWWKRDAPLPMAPLGGTTRRLDWCAGAPRAGPVPGSGVADLP